VKVAIRQAPNDSDGGATLHELPEYHRQLLKASAPIVPSVSSIRADGVLNKVEKFMGRIF